MEQSPTIQILGVIAIIAALLGWLTKVVVQYFIRHSNNQMTYIEKLVSINQKNTEDFVNTINHQRTLDREIQQKHLTAINDLKAELSTTNRINERLITVLGNKKHG